MPRDHAIGSTARCPRCSKQLLCFDGASLSRHSGSKGRQGGEPAGLRLHPRQLPCSISWSQKANRAKGLSATDLQAGPPWEWRTQHR
jgi:hypothetical protein